MNWQWLAKKKKTYKIYAYFFSNSGPAFMEVSGLSGYPQAIAVYLAADIYTVSGETDTFLANICEIKMWLINFLNNKLWVLLHLSPSSHAFSLVVNTSIFFDIEAFLLYHLFVLICNICLFSFVIKIV